jgi:CO/xanthine dehydrogenase FAD-binding subunit
LRLSDIEVTTPRNLDDALSLLREKAGKLKPIAGGTDAIIELKGGLVKAAELLDLSSLSDLRYISKDGAKIRIGALSTYSDIIESSITNDHCKVLVEASRTIGAPQLQNRATMGGNLANASPSGDTIPPLYALDATVSVQNLKATRRIPIEKFFLGYRKIDLRPDELITEIAFDAIENPCDATFLKLGLREAHFISIASAAVWAKWASKGSRFSDIRVALGAVAPTVVRARKCEESLRDSTLAEDSIWKACELAPHEASPISDIRASAQYRRAMISSLVYKSVQKLVESAKERKSA